MYFNTEDTPLYISEYSLLAFGDKHLLHMLIYWDFTTLTVYQAKSKLNKINLYCMLGYIRIYSGYKSMQKNSHCVFWYFKTFIAYWDLSVLFVYICIKTSNVYYLSFRMFQNLQCVFCSVYRCISSVLFRISLLCWDILPGLPLYIEICQNLHCALGCTLTEDVVRLLSQH